MNLPEEYIKRASKIIPDFSDYLNCLDKKPHRALRLDTSRMSFLDFSKNIPFEISPVPFCENAFLFDFDGIGNHPVHHSGAVYVQEPSAMAPVASLPELPCLPILDVCASPGGKSLMASARISDKSVIVSNEFSQPRIKTLNQNIERCGVKNSIITNFDGEKIDSFLPQVFGTVIVDAPCSGEGMMRKTPLAAENWNLGNILISAERQKNILQSASRLVLPGGYLVYSTCTFSPEENEEQIALFLSQNPDFSLVPPKKEVADFSLPGIPSKLFPEIPTSLCRRFYPHKSVGEGQFLALMKKEGTLPEINFKAEENRISKESLKITLDFLENTLIGIPDMCISEEKDGVYLVPHFPKLKKPPFSCGVKIGTIEKSRLVPHHRFFMAFGKDFRRKAEIGKNSELVKKYLSGEEIPSDCEKGFCAVTYFGAPTGGGKVSGGILKNHYPKGLRTKIG